MPPANGTKEVATNGLNGRSQSGVQNLIIIIIMIIILKLSSSEIEMDIEIVKANE